MMTVSQPTLSWRNWLGGTAWIYLLLAPIFGYLLLVSLLEDGYLNFLAATGNLLILLLPVIAFAGFRDAGMIPDRYRRLLWVGAYFLYPLLFVLLHDWSADRLFTGVTLLHPEELDDQFSVSFFLFVAGTVVATELGLQLLSKQQQRVQLLLVSNRFWLWVVGGLTLIACGDGAFQTTTGFGAGVGRTLYLWPQLLFIVGMYYGYYQLNANFLIPKVLRKLGFLRYGFALVGSILVAYPLFALVIRTLPVVTVLELEVFHPASQVFLGDAGVLPLLLMLLTTPFLISYRWLQQGQQIARLESERSQAELALLKQQINPHFFFNTLNNLYALSIEEDERTPEVILRLSELMRYVIYSGPKEQVPLAKEVKYIEDYVHLQRMRLRENCTFTFTKEGLDGNLELPPLLFINLVENAFKHGIEPARGATYLHLTLTVADGELRFSCRNSVERPASDDTTGSGLSNLRRRLELRYPSAHSLTARAHPKEYLAEINLTL